MAVKEWFRQLQPVQLYLVLFFTSTFFIIEIIASHVTHSLTLLLNAYHMLCNIVALVGCIASIKYGKQDKCRRDRNSKDSIFCIKENENPSASESKHSCSDSRMKNTFGWARIDILTMLICCVLLASFCFSLLVEALQTLIHIDHLDEMHHPVPVMCIGVSGILLNAFCYIIIGGYTFNQGLLLHVTKDGNVVLQKSIENATDEQRLANPTRRSPLAIPRRQGFQEMCRDVLGCILVVVNSLLVYLTDAHLAKFFDPIFAIISSVSLFALSYPYLRESGLILLQTIPNHINIDSLKKELLAAFPGIVNVHDFHVWQLAGEKIVSTIHIIFLDQTVYSVIIDQVTAFFMEMGITHVTIQPEFQKMKEVSKSDCLIRCRGKRCIESQCCSKDDLLDEVILDKSDKIINKKFLRKEIIPSQEDVNLKKFTLHKSDSTKSMNVSLKDTEKISVPKPSRDHRNSCPDGNVSVINVDVNSVRADPCENVKK
ncbi:zinc transporter 1 [Cotesia glomerata]|uniref:zinc transporter 1 n=1 Tax=Cotesia glomerata TaxID=32391 RepID=UPI001D014786|nr:zinc transporter 1 [Cotesia glomerata]XP_044593700.1 zinc transporter 1 [Cotesia glomerata]XP_044593701.1 zinc transporter 1 [Cotesia glomerata]XP_044593702.1 zinc transporter 1 [Cotesia glomerata]XP_044593704.1 zinc transporter 1 [Cotesia glomerata]